MTLVAACSTPRADLGEPIDQTVAVDSYRARVVLEERSRDDLLFMVSLSGGGTRAAAMAVGVLEQLATDQVGAAENRKRLIEEIDIISAVSGGAVTAAYYAVHGDRVFTDFSRQFLERNVTAALRRKIVWSPWGWVRLASREYARGDLYAEYLDEQLFNGARFSDLVRRKGLPLLIISATDVAQSTRFEFTQEQFDTICSRLESFSLARAVAASSAVPALLTPITLRNHVDRCGQAFDDVTQDRFAYLHLVDGALSDNLGARVLLDAIRDPTDRLGLQRFPSSGLAPKIVYISVNAGDPKSSRVGGRRKPPDALDMLRLMGTVPVDHYTAETQSLLRKTLTNHAELKHATLYYISVELGELRENERLDRLVELPTSFNLKRDDVDALRCAARQLLIRSDAYRELLATLGGTSPEGLSRCKES